MTCTAASRSPSTSWRPRSNLATLRRTGLAMLEPSPKEIQGTTPMYTRRFACLAATGLLLLGNTARAQESFAKPAAEVNKKMVKLFGSGGFRGLASYGTGIIVSPEGHILTVASHLLDTQELRVHTYDGRRFQAKIVLSS